jgi:phage host-nuclease inhibitor protein Gam
MNTTTKKPTRTKAPALTVNVPQSKEMAAQQLHQLGIVIREHTRLTTELNDQIGLLTQDAQPRLEKLKAQAQSLQAGLQTWCEAHRATLLAEGGKTANLVTGEVSWRIRPPSVTVRGVEDVIAQLQSNQLHRFIREKFEVNKEAILNDPDAVSAIKGITVVSGVEDFIATPFEAKTAGA